MKPVCLSICLSVHLPSSVSVTLSRLVTMLKMLDSQEEERELSINVKHSKNFFLLVLIFACKQQLELISYPLINPLTYFVSLLNN